MIPGNSGYSTIASSAIKRKVLCVILRKFTDRKAYKRDKNSAERLYRRNYSALQNKGRYEIPVYRPIQTQAASVFGNEDVRQVTTRPAGVTTGQPVQEAQLHCYHRGRTRDDDRIKKKRRCYLSRSMIAIFSNFIYFGRSCSTIWTVGIVNRNSNSARVYGGSRLPSAF